MNSNIVNRNEGGMDVKPIPEGKSVSQELQSIDPIAQKKRRVGDVNDTVGCVVIDHRGRQGSGDCENIVPE